MSFREYLQKVSAGVEGLWTDAELRATDSWKAFVERQYMYGYTVEECKANLDQWYRF